MTEADDLYSSLIANCVFNVFLSYTAITLNSVTIHAIRRTSSLPKTLKTLLLSLAVSDLGVGLLVQPLLVAVVVMLLEQNTENNSNYNATFKAYLIAINLFVYVSFFGVTALSADRFLAIHFHLRYQEIVTHKRVVAVVISIWVFSAFLSFLAASDWISVNIFRAICVAIEVACFISTAFFYYKIYSAVRRHTDEIHALQIAQNVEMAHVARQIKSAVCTWYVYLVFLFCNLPNTCIYVAAIISGVNTVITNFSIYAGTLVLLNSSLNPLLFNWKIRHTRHAIMEILRNIYPSHN